MLLCTFSDLFCDNFFAFMSFIRLSFPNWKMDRSLGRGFDSGFCGVDRGLFGMFTLAFCEGRLWRP